MKTRAHQVGRKLGFNHAAAEPRFKLGAPRPGTSVRDYEAVDGRDRRIAGPFKSYGDAKHAAGPGGHVKYVRPRARAEAKRGGDEARGREYAQDQVQSEHFNNWIWDQMIEAEELRKSDPSQVRPLNTDADFKRVAKAMLQQLRWDIGRSRELNNESDEFIEGIRNELESEHMVDWLVDELKSIDEQMKGPRHEQLPLPRVYAKRARPRPKAKRSARKKRR